MAKKGSEKMKSIQWPDKFRGLAVVLTKLNEQKTKDEIYDLLNIEYHYLGYLKDLSQNTFDELFDLASWIFDLTRKFVSEFPDNDPRDNGNSEIAREILFRILRDNYDLKLHFQDFNIFFDVAIGYRKEEIFEEKKLVSQMQEWKDRAQMFSGPLVKDNDREFDKEYDSDILNVVQEEGNISRQIITADRTEISNGDDKIITSYIERQAMVEGNDHSHKGKKLQSFNASENHTSIVV